MGNPWKHDPEGMNDELVKAMVHLGHAGQNEDPDKVLKRWDKMSGPDFLKVTDEAEAEYNSRFAEV